MILDNGAISIAKLHKCPILKMNFNFKYLGYSQQAGWSTRRITTGCDLHHTAKTGIKQLERWSNAGDRNVTPNHLKDLL